MVGIHGGKHLGISPGILFANFLLRKIIMPRLTQLMKVDVQDHGEVNGQRKIQVEIVAPNRLLLCSDLLASNHIIMKLQARMRTATKKALAEYIQSGRGVVRKAKTKRHSKSKPD